MPSALLNARCLENSVRHIGRNSQPCQSSCALACADSLSMRLAYSRLVCTKACLCGRRRELKISCLGALIIKRWKPAAVAVRSCCECARLSLRMRWQLSNPFLPESSNSCSLMKCHAQDCDRDWRTLLRRLLSSCPARVGDAKLTRRSCRWQLGIVAEKSYEFLAKDVSRYVGHDRASISSRFW